MKGNRTVLIFLAVVLGILFTVNTILHFSSEPLDAGNLTDIVMASALYEEVIDSFELEHGDGVVCFATIANDDSHFDIVYLEKKQNTYSYKSKVTLNVNMVSNDDTCFDEFFALHSSYKNQSVYYSVFSDPQRKSVIVNDNEVDVELITFELGGETYTFGFWSVVLPDDVPVTVS